MYDIVIIGAGPAGLTASIYARRAGKSVLVIEKGVFGGQMTFSPKIENYPGFTEISGNALADKMVEHALALGADIEMDTVKEIVPGDVKTVVCEGASYEAKAVVIASGAKHRHLGVEGEEELIGSGISFCAVCDGAFYKNADVCVVGGGNSAMQEAVLLSQTSASVTMVQNLAFLTGETKLADAIGAADNISVVYNSVVTGVYKDGEKIAVKTKNTAGEESVLLFDGVFVAIGLSPDTECFKNIIDINSRGCIEAGEDTKTSAQGIFAAGDCRTKTVRQISTACADGAAAALAAVSYIDGNQ